MSLERTTGLILKSIKYSDTDRIITCYTHKYGKIQCIAKRARRQKSNFLSNIDLLTYAELVIVKKGIKNIYPLREAVIIQSYHRLYEDPPRLYAAFYMAELIQELTPAEDKKPEILSLILRQLDMLQKGEDREKLTLIFEVRLLSLLGYQPQLEKCLFCLAPVESSKMGFIPSMGGIVCQSCCQKKHISCPSISLGSLNFLRQAIKFPLNKTDRLCLTSSNRKELLSLLHAFITYHLCREIRSYRFIQLNC
ncbi:MAG: DNA repair protein RecO [bacterium]|nr:DNA repair protein RecO [bacterium]